MGGAWARADRRGEGGAGEGSIGRGGKSESSVATGALLTTAGAVAGGGRRRWSGPNVKHKLCTLLPAGQHDQSCAPCAHVDQQCVGVQEEGQGRRGGEEACSASSSALLTRVLYHTGGGGHLVGGLLAAAVTL